jgi:hypothetical protein
MITFKLQLLVYELGWAVVAIIYHKQPFAIGLWPYALSGKYASWSTFEVSQSSTCSGPTLSFNYNCFKLTLYWN